jgi:hypothetical protein
MVTTLSAACTAEITEWDVAALMAEFEAEIAEESSPIQIWPHHFDMSLLWLPGEKIPGRNPNNKFRSESARTRITN